MSRNVEVDDTTTVMGQNDKHQQDLEPDRWHREEVHRSQLRHVIVEKRSPGLRRWTGAAYHVLRDRGLGYVETQFQQSQLTVDSRCAPEWIGPAHLLDYLSHLRVDLRSTGSLTALPSPVEPKAFPMPCHYSSGLNNDQTRAPIGPESGQSDPEPAIGHLQFGTRGNLPLEDAKLMTKSDDLQMQSGPSSKPAGKRIEEREEEFTHGSWNIVPSELNFNAHNADGVFSKDTPFSRGTKTRNPSAARTRPDFTLLSALVLVRD